MSQSHKIALSQRIQAVEPSPTLTISALAASLKAQGRDILSFSAGEPDFNTPDHIIQAAQEALDQGKTRYLPVAGTKELRQAVADLYKGRGVDVTADQVVVSTGAKFSLYQAIQATIGPGDEVIIPAPYWVSYPAQVALAGGTSVFATATEETEFKLTPETLKAAITPRTRMLILNTPSNPTGAVYTRAELEALADVVLEHGIAVLYDSIYDELIYNGEPIVEFATLRPGLEELTITVNGLSKSHAMTGWRVGYLVAPLHVAKAVSKLQSQSTSCITSFVQPASVAAITGDQGPTQEMRGHFDRRRKLMVKLLRAIDGVTCVEPMGAFYAFPNMSAFLGKSSPKGTIEDDVALASYLLEEHGVALVPGSAFGAPGFMRLSYATSDEIIEAGIARIARGLAALG
jgi:aspartate aminotransferase